jgi:prepilin-type N-terminal cleavage/methylation domain-containing protein
MKNEKGLTLIELLAAISILFIVSSVIYGVFFGFNNNYKQISEKSSMDQTANIVLATIQQYHLKHDTYEIRFDSKKQAAFIQVSGSETRLGDESVKMQLKLGYPQAQAFSGSNSINSHEPLAIELILTNNSGKSYEVETIIKRY